MLTLRLEALSIAPLSARIPLTDRFQPPVSVGVGDAGQCFSQYESDDALRGDIDLRSPALRQEIVSVSFSRIAPLLLGKDKTIFWHVCQFIKACLSESPRVRESERPRTLFGELGLFG